MAYANPRSDVSVFYANSRSLVNKINQLELEIATYQYDLMVFTETHLDSSILDSELFPSIYTVFRRDRVQNGRRGGGILIAVRDTLRASVREDVNFDSELLFVDILFPANRKISLGVFYRPPNSSINCLLDLQTALDTVLSSSQNPEMVLVGDFNIPEFDWNTDCASVDSPNATFLSDITHDTFLFQLVKDPTRNGNILDLVFVTSLDLVYDLKVGLPFSDHNSISMLLSRKSFSGRKSQKLSYSFKKADWNHLRNLLYYTPWHCAFMDTDIDCIWAAWSDMFLSAVNECIPRRTVKRTSNAPWISGDLIKLCRRKKVLYKRAKKKPVLCLIGTNIVNSTTM